MVPQTLRDQLLPFLRATPRRAEPPRFAQNSAAAGLLTVLLILTGACLAKATSEAPASARALISAASTLSVDHIPSVERIDHWEALDNRHVLLSVDAGRSYVLTLAQNCHQLNWAQSVDVSRSDNAIWAQFDYVAADGWHCSIGEIHQLNAL